MRCWGWQPSPAPPLVLWLKRQCAGHGFGGPRRLCSRGFDAAGCSAVGTASAGQQRAPFDVQCCCCSCWGQCSIVVRGVQACLPAALPPLMPAQVPHSCRSTIPQRSLCRCSESSNYTRPSDSSTVPSPPAQSRLWCTHSEWPRPWLGSASARHWRCQAAPQVLQARLCRGPSWGMLPPASPSAPPPPSPSSRGHPSHPAPSCAVCRQLHKTSPLRKAAAEPPLPRSPAASAADPTPPPRLPLPPPPAYPKWQFKLVTVGVPLLAAAISFWTATGPFDTFRTGFFVTLALFALLI